MKKRIVSMALAGAFAVTALAGCGSTGSSSADSASAAEKTQESACGS